MNFKRAKQEKFEILRERTILGSSKGVTPISATHTQANGSLDSLVLPLVQDPSTLKVLRPGSVAAQVRKSYASVLGFEDNQFKK